MSDDLVEVTQADKEAAKGAWEKAALADLYCDPRNTGPDFGPEPRDPEGVLAEAFARHRLASQPVPASSDLVERVAEGICCPKGCMVAGTDRICAAGGFEPQARAIIPIIHADQRERDAKVLQSAVETLAASRHLIAKYVPDHHWLPEHDERIAALKTAIRERNGSD